MYGKTTTSILSANGMERHNPIGTTFRSRTNIYYFNEFKYFTNTRFNTTAYANNGEFYGCSNLVEIDLTNITYLSCACFMNCSKLKHLNNLSKTILFETNGSGPIQGCKALEGEIDMTDGGWYRSGRSYDLSSQIFRNTGWSVIRLPKATSRITSGYVFMDATRLTTLIVPGDTLVTITNSNALSNMPSTTNIYVPDDLVASYKAASYWSARASRIFPLSEYVG